MLGELLLVSVMVLVAYVAGYLLGRSDERRAMRRRSAWIGRARERQWQEHLGEAGSPKMN